MPQHLRVFISSPGDVPDEQLRADLVVDKVAQDFSRFFTFETYRWEHEPMLASGHFQDAIEPPSKADIVILIIWSRLGTPLPERTGAREYRGLDGRAPVTGTEWEYEDALKAAREHGAPDILAFRNVSPASIDTRDSAAREKSLKQLDALERLLEAALRRSRRFPCGLRRVSDNRGVCAASRRIVAQAHRAADCGAARRADASGDLAGRSFPRARARTNLNTRRFSSGATAWWRRPPSSWPRERGRERRFCW